MFKELRNILDINNIKMVYFAIIQSILTYGIIVWGSAYKNVLEPLNIVHRIIVRIILNQYYKEGSNTNELFKILKVLTIEQLYDKLSITKIYMIKNQYKSQNKKITRNTDKGNLKLFKPNTNVIKLFYIYRGIKLFNDLPNNIKLINNKKQFKMEIKRWYARLFH